MSASPDRQICVPCDILEVCEHEPEQAKQIQSEMRSEFQDSFRQSLVVTGFELDDRFGKYLLERV